MFMEFFQILSDCSGNVASCCSDYGLAVFLHIIKEAMKIIQIVVPIILIAMCTVDLVKLVINPDDNNKAKFKGLLNKVFAAVVVFVLPIIINAVMDIVADSLTGVGSFNISECWDAADEIWSNTQKK